MESTPLVQRRGDARTRNLHAVSPEYVISVFEPIEGHGGSSETDEIDAVDDVSFYDMVDNVRATIADGVQPRMISLGSSGSYVVWTREESGMQIAGVFKPMDEEPYGNLNPKRIFLRKYLWWAMGRPCLIPNFSYLSEVGASYLNDRLGLTLVPTTRLVGFSSPSFHYLYSDKKRWERNHIPLPVKIGSLQRFLDGYVNASEFLQKHSLPGRPRDLLVDDLEAENRAHRLSRRKERARLRMCFIGLKRLLLCRYGRGPYGSSHVADQGSAVHTDAHTAYPTTKPMSRSQTTETFVWTERRWNDFRHELEKLVILDFLMRNTDRGLDNFMIYVNEHPRPGESSITIGAIDNSLAFPHRHPHGLRDYPYGWLFLPTSIIGLPFSDETRRLFLPKLCSPAWWQKTTEGLARIFSQDAHFHLRTFERQMEVMRGQGHTIVQCLQNKEDGPMQLCAYPKRLVRQSVHMLTPSELRLHSAAELAPASSAHTVDATQGLEAMDMKHGASMDSDLSQEMHAPHSLSTEHLGRSPESEPRAIDVVERISALADRVAKSALEDTQKRRIQPQRERPLTGYGAVHIASQSMHTPNHPSSVPQGSMPVLVEHLVPDTHSTWST
ncbi:1-phosphatidylinositol 4-kinase [Malassezia vespertilionis]|nr:1-phosphatidylinositol 4-kinase [Malassezia vespertilionis]WFD07254.1 1-phosphatidylinositol 4-kinase [Malassezia vespertilionis]